MTDSEYIHDQGSITIPDAVRFPKRRTDGGDGFPPKSGFVTFETKDDRIRRFIKEFSDEDLTRMLLDGNTIYGPDSVMDHETDIADQMQDELDDREYHRVQEQERKANPLWGAFE